MTPTTIAITGASGQLGRLAIAHLKTLTDPAGIVALARDPAKVADLGVAARAFDYTQPETMGAALAGVQTLVLISSNDFNDRVGQHRNVIEAATAAGVGRIVYTSILKADRSPMLIAADHRETEAVIAASGLPAAILRNGWYTENWTANLCGAIAAGALIGAAGTARFTPAARRDYAEALAVVAADAGRVGVLELAGDEGFPLADLAAEVSRQTGKALPYNDLPPEVYQGLLESFGLPAGFAAVLVDVDVKAAGGWLEDESGTLARLLGRPTVRMAEAVAVAM
ncbi:NAD(P)H-binding protein [Frigidibacter albus]|uniref:NAD(P)H-binding protein n=1 Tax=Frigidibacter albus TaxID=1465486 RepID=A0A6L8VE65_9RHOB|nr:NAD(P)H-binding protein [Frigidibacter albus]MZQ88464.1 NAD(P)H-binding protein [Frigidibacter albus]NBE30727.1 NAD(P)H-binding protein [Frigidibacter albus]GGH48438.1 NAD(P)-dependent oxidoreductase [Frigidibacter albus]